jgi:hypothetical protein
VRPRIGLQIKNSEVKRKAEMGATCANAVQHLNDAWFCPTIVVDIDGQT